MKSMRSGGAIPPLKRGISAILARYPMKTRQMGAIPPSAILSRKGIARYGGVSRTGPLRAHSLKERAGLAMCSEGSPRLRPHVASLVPARGNGGGGLDSKAKVSGERGGEREIQREGERYR